MKVARKAMLLWAIFLTIGLSVTPGAYANMLQNPSFEMPEPNGSPTSLTGYLVSRYSAAQD